MNEIYLLCYCLVNLTIVALIADHLREIALFDYCRNGFHEFNIWLLEITHSFEKVLNGIRTLASLKVTLRWNSITLFVNIVISEYIVFARIGLFSLICIRLWLWLNFNLISCSLPSISAVITMFTLIYIF